MKPIIVPDQLPTVPWERVEGFVGQLTHDIRNGLNAVELQLTYLGEISTDPEAVDEIKRLRNSLANVTRQLLTLRTAMVTVTPYPQEYPAEEFFDDLRERFAKLRTEGTGEVVWDVKLDAGSLLSVDPELTINALLELLGNALHFTRGATEPIRVQVTQDEHRVTFSLREPQPAEPGVPPDDWGRTPLLTTRRGAYGLGLFRVRRCLEAQGGTLDVAYSGEQNTLTTNVTLPGTAPKQP